MSLGLYVFAVLRLKNREFYPQLAHLHGPELERMMSNVFTYAVLELVSLVLMTYLLKKKLRIDTTRQLTFVLQRQWTMVHSKILMWFFYVVQTSLVHFGAPGCISTLTVGSFVIISNCVYVNDLTSQARTSASSSHGCTTASKLRHLRRRTCNE